jgi:hypothetical protein
LARSEWGLWDDRLKDTTKALMVRAYMRRKQFEARILLSEIMEALGQGTGERGTVTKISTSGGRFSEVTPDQFLGITGGKLS